MRGEIIDANTYAQSLFEKLSSIRLIQIIEKTDTETRNSLRIFLSSALADQPISTCLSRDSHASSDWIKAVLQDNHIQGRFYCSFDDKKARAAKIGTPAWVIVDILDYDWVKPLWELGYHFSFVPLDFSYQLEIMWDESQFVAYFSYRQHIVARLSEFEALEKEDPTACLPKFDPSKYNA